MKHASHKATFTVSRQKFKLSEGNCLPPARVPIPFVLCVRCNPLVATPLFWVGSGHRREDQRNRPQTRQFHL